MENHWAYPLGSLVLAGLATLLYIYAVNPTRISRNAFFDNYENTEKEWMTAKQSNKPDSKKIDELEKKLKGLSNKKPGIFSFILYIMSWWVFIVLCVGSIYCAYKTWTLRHKYVQLLSDKSPMRGSNPRP
jgi:hypothetical protein